MGLERQREGQRNHGDEPLDKAVRRRPGFIKRFSELQGEKGEPGAILTGDIPLERLRARKVTMSPDPEGTHLLHPIFASVTNRVHLSDKSVSPCFRVNLESVEPRDRW